MPCIEGDGSGWCGPAPNCESTVQPANPASVRSTGQTTLRALLRAATAPDHDRLDRMVGALDLAVHADYARFLRIQLAAREALEPQLAARLGPAAPPSQSALIRHDLAAIGEVRANPHLSAPLPADSDPIGACWALAGSHLGNRAMLHALGSRAAPGWPTSFLADGAIAAYWQTLRESLARPARPDDPAIPAAQAVFRVFLAAATAQGLDQPPGRAAA